MGEICGTKLTRAFKTCWNSLKFRRIYDYTYLKICINLKVLIIYHVSCFKSYA